MSSALYGCVQGQEASDGTYFPAAIAVVELKLRFLYVIGDIICM